MSAQHARSKLTRRRSGSGDGLSSLTGSASERSSAGLLAEVVTTEPSIKRALAPLVRHALAKNVSVVCEIMAGVGRYVLGSRRQLGDLVARAAAEGIAKATSPAEVCVRVARQRSGFAPTDTVIVSVSILSPGKDIEDVACHDAVMPLAEGEELADAIVLADKRVLLVVPTAHGARVQTSAAKRFGAVVESVLLTCEATERLRAAHDEGKPFDVMYVDEATQGAEALLGAARDDLSLGAPCRIVATALDDGSDWTSRGAESLLSKPVLPLELCDALRDSTHVVTTDLEEAEAAAVTQVPPPYPSKRRVSGIRRLDLAAVLAAVAVSSTRARR